MSGRWTAWTDRDGSEGDALVGGVKGRVGWVLGVLLACFIFSEVT